MAKRQPDMKRNVENRIAVKSNWKKIYFRRFLWMWLLAIQRIYQKAKNKK